LPIVLRGSSSTSSSALGCLNRARLGAQPLGGDGVEVGLAPGSGTSTPSTASPKSGCGTPITALSFTPGTSSSSSSTSLG
jgi:hypothetical protein